MADLLVYRFQNRIKKSSVNAVLANFLKNKDGDLSEKERVWWALSAFWLPIAMKASSDYTQEEITQYTLSAIARLQQQISYLSLVANLDSSSSSPSTSNSGFYDENEFETISPKRQDINHKQEPQEQTGLEKATRESKTDSNDFDSVFGYQ